MKKKARDPTVKAVRNVRVAGVAVRVALDEDGRPLYVTAGAWGDANAPQATLAAQHVFDRTEHAAQSTKRERVRAKATAKSEEVRDAGNHQANAWFAQALAEDPKRGMKKLVHAARRLALAANVSLEQRDEITDDRARRFLERQPKP